MFIKFPVGFLLRCSTRVNLQSNGKLRHASFFVQTKSSEKFLTSTTRSSVFDGFFLMKFQRPVWTNRCFFSAQNDQQKNNSNINVQKNNKVKPGSNKVFTVPNILCMARISITPVIGYLILQNNFQYALALCAISSMTDFLDGWIARRFNAESKLGAVLDPMADKLLVVTLALTLTYVHMIPFWLTALIFTRDFLIITGGSYMRFRSLPPPFTWERYFDSSTFKSEIFRPTFISKLNTALQLSLVLVTLSSPLFLDFFQKYHLILPGLQWATGITTLWSGLLYLKRL